MGVIVHLMSDEEPKPRRPRFPDETDYCRVCGGVVNCLRGRALGEPLKPRADCPHGDVHPSGV